MAENLPEKQNARPRSLVQRLPGLVAIVALVVIGIAVAGTAVAWGHFWNFSVGSPSAETCSSCHILEPYVDSLTTTNLLAGAHALKGVACTDCHDYDLERQISRTITYLANSEIEPVAQDSYAMDFCFQCHEHGSYDQIAWRTMDLGVADQQSKGHEGNPHRSPHYTNLECNNCHQVHEASTLMCWECHAFDYGNSQFVREAFVMPIHDEDAEPGMIGTPAADVEATEETPAGN